MKPQYQKLTLIEFNRAVKHLKKSNSRLSDHSLDLARHVLVEGIPASTLARHHQCTAQLVNRVAAKLHQAFIESQDLPSGWVSIRVELPAEEAEKIQDLEKRLKKSL